MAFRRNLGLMGTKEIQMKKNLSNALFIFSVLFTLTTVPSAMSAESAPANPDANPNVSSERNQNESWYWGFNLGGGKIKYKKAALEAATEATKNAPNSDHGTYFFDLFFIWPLSNQQTAMGVSLGGIADSYKDNTTNVEETLNSSMLAFSVHHFFTGNIGDGFFARGDIGLASVSYNVRSNNVSTTSDSYNGLGLRLGLGYSILLSDETRLPISLQWQNTSVENDNGSNAVLLAVGLLF